MTARAKMTEPFDRLLKIGEVRAIVGGLAVSTIYRKMQAGKFPRPLDLGGSVRWKKSEVVEWAAAKAQKIDDKIAADNLAALDEEIRHTRPSFVVDTSKSSRVYFIRLGDNGPIKIGFANDTRKRLSSLQVGVPYDLSVLVDVPGTLKDERNLHLFFDMERLRGEWFRPSPRLLDFIAELAA